VKVVVEASFCKLALTPLLRGICDLGLVILGSPLSCTEGLHRNSVVYPCASIASACAGLQEPVKVWVCNQDPQDRQLLENYLRQGSLSLAEYVDPQTRPGLADKFGVKNLEVYLEWTATTVASGCE